MIFTLDGGNAGRCGQVSLGEGDEIRPLRTMQFPDSLGWFYSRITALLGLRPHWDEHKVQWLGREGQPEFLPVFRKLFRADKHGLPVLDRRYFAAGSDERGTFSPQFFREMKINKEKLRGDSAVRAAIARSAQLFLEEAVLDIAHYYQAQYGCDSLCLAGGVFLNVLLVRALETRSTFDHVYVQPVAGNAGTALGAAFLARKKLNGKSGRAALKTLALGPELGSQSIKAVLDNCKIIYKYTSGEDHLISECVKILAARQDRGVVPGAHRIRPSRAGQPQHSRVALFRVRDRQRQSVHQAPRRLSSFRAVGAGGARARIFRRFAELPVHGVARETAIEHRRARTVRVQQSRGPGSHRRERIESEFLATAAKIW